jgi:hypothetical protein
MLVHQVWQAGPIRLLVDGVAILVTMEKEGHRPQGTVLRASSTSSIPHQENVQIFSDFSAFLSCGKFKS